MEGQFDSYNHLDQYMLLGEINKHQSSLGEINTKSKSINVCCIFIVSPLSIAPTIGQEAPPGQLVDAFEQERRHLTPMALRGK